MPMSNDYDDGGGGGGDDDDNNNNESPVLTVLRGPKHLPPHSRNDEASEHRAVRPFGWPPRVRVSQSRAHPWQEGHAVERLPARLLSCPAA